MEDSDRECLQPLLADRIEDSTDHLLLINNAIITTFLVIEKCY